MLKVFSFSIEQNFIPTIDDNNIYIGIIKRKEMIRYLGDNLNKIFLIKIKKFSINSIVHVRDKSASESV